MAMVLNWRLAPSITALVGGCCHCATGTRGESGLVEERPLASVWRMRSRQTQVNKRGAQQQMRTNLPSVTQQRSKSSSPLLETSCGTHPSAAKVFEDEAKGICCYPLGEVTCEGYNAGPHFEPEKRWERTSVSCDAAPTKEEFDYKYVTGGQGKAWCEGKDEC